MGTGLVYTAYTIGRIHGAKEFSKRIIEHWKKN